IIWLWRRLSRKARTLLNTGNMTANVRQIFTPKTITILGSMFAALFNLWILVRLVLRDASFDRWGLLSAITVSVLIAYWVNKIVLVTSSKTEQKLRDAEGRIAQLETQEAQNRDRHVTSEQRATLLDLLKETKGQFDLMTGGVTRESLDFAAELALALKDAGWIVYRRGNIIGPAGPRGIRLIVQDSANPRA